jgi:hypothetical protein
MIRTQLLLIYLSSSISSLQAGPLEIILMAGEYQVVKSIIEYSIPRLVGWTTMLDSAIEEAISGASNQDNDSYNNRGGSGGNVPF